VLGRLIALVVPLGIDSFVVAAAIGLVGVTPAVRWRVGGIFALFEGGMPLLGLLAGGPLGHALGAAADYVAIAVLVAFGAFTMVREDDDELGRARRLAGARGRALLLLGMSVSLDELAIGFTLGLLRLPVVPVVVAIAVQAFVVSQLGIALGARLSHTFREAAEKVAGAALIGLAAVLLVQRLAHG
jgi:manganese efflux pump family protein